MFQYRFWAIFKPTPPSQFGKWSEFDFFCRFWPATWNCLYHTNIDSRELIFCGLILRFLKKVRMFFLIRFEPENMPNLCDFGCIFEGKIRVPRPRKLSRENVFFGMKTTFFNNFSKISSKEDTFICHVPKFHDFRCTRSTVIADCLGRKIGDSPCSLKGVFYSLVALWAEVALFSLCGYSTGE